jgi:hypothetical protein
MVLFHMDSREIGLSCTGGGWTGPDLQFWGPRGNQNMETPISNNKFR